MNNNQLGSNYYAKEKYELLKIIVDDEPQLHGDILRFKTKVIAGYKNNKQQRVSGQLLLALKVDSLNSLSLKYGDELIISAQYLPVEPPYNFAEFDFKGWLACQNIYHQAFINQAHLLKTGRNVGNPLIKYALIFRAKQIAKYRKLIKNDEAFAVASTLILGYRANLSKDTLSAYSKTGTIHALSVSGSHVAIIFIVLDFLLSALNKKKNLKIIKLIVISSLIWNYALITGMSPSVVRSAIMVSIFICAKTFSKDKNSYNILAFSAFCTLIYNPFLLWDVGFQLSYLSVFGLIYLQVKIYNFFYVKNRLLDKIWNFTALSLSAQLVTFPLSIYYFHQFPLYFLVANLFISIPLILMMYFGIAVLIPGLTILAPIFEFIVVTTNAVLKWIASLPFAAISSICITLPELLLLSFGLGLLVFAFDKGHKKLLFLSLFIFILYSGLLINDDLNAYKQRKVIYFTLRKNYAAAFIHGKTAVLITDLPEQDKNFQFFIKPCLDALKINQYNLIDFQTDTVLPHFVKQQKQIIFFDYKILLVDQSLNYKVINTKLPSQNIWLHNNPKFDLKTLSLLVNYKNIVIDGSNKDYKIAEYKKFAENNKLDFHVLKKNKAYLMDLNR